MCIYTCSCPYYIDNAPRVSPMKAITCFQHNDRNYFTDTANSNYKKIIVFALLCEQNSYLHNNMYIPSKMKVINAHCLQFPHNNVSITM